MLIVALARPQRTVAAPLRAATVMMVTDTSGSMRANDVEPDRMTAAVRAALKLTDELPEEYRLGLVSFADYAEQQAPPTTDRVPVEAALRGLVANGGTAMVEGIQRGIQAARVPVADESGAGRRRLPAAIVLLSDGAETEGGDPAQVAAEARRANIPVYTVALGTPDGEVEQTDPYGFTRRVPVPPEIDTLQMIAQHHARALLRRRGRRPARVDLREPRHAAVLEARAGGDHRRGRRRRAAPARRRRRAGPRLVRAPARLSRLSGARPAR